MHDVTFRLLAYAGIMLVVLGVLWLGMLITRYNRLTISPYVQSAQPTFRDLLRERIETAVEVNEDFHESLESNLPPGTWRG